MSLFDLQDAVLADLNTSFPGLNAEKSNRPLSDLGDSDVQKVFVVKGGAGPSKLMNRQPTYEDLLKIQIGVIKRVSNQVEEDAVIKVAEDIRRFYVGRGLTGVESKYQPHEVISISIYDYQILDEDSQIISAVEMTFKEWRSN